MARQLKVKKKNIMSKLRGAYCYYPDNWLYFCKYTPRATQYSGAIYEPIQLFRIASAVSRTTALRLKPLAMFSPSRNQVDKTWEISRSRNRCDMQRGNNIPITARRMSSMAEAPYRAMAPMARRARAPAGAKPAAPATTTPVGWVPLLWPVGAAVV